ncbi:MAG: hypothetical protein D9V46_07075 [Deltaproteobacteria bacterium]|uniref:hypothetical protein n=1 Tax=Hydrosulfovibrio ferrireducens TaxID=2934181 RepID=UPI0012226F79|nr:MAG: hypothetical protein D9V46_07075 [Deltaproteobacteria bacterium]
MAETSVRAIPPKLYQELRKFCPDQQPADSPWGSTADEFANEIIAEAIWAAEQLFCMQEDITKGQVRAEWEDLQQTLRSAKRNLEAGKHKLRNISPGLDRLLALDSDPLGCADQMEICSCFVSTLIDHLEFASSRIEGLRKSDRPDQKEHWVAVEMAINVLRVLKKHGIPPSIYASADHSGCQSKAVTILWTIGEHIGLAMSLITWRDIIGEARQQAADLNQEVANPQS